MFKTIKKIATATAFVMLLSTPTVFAEETSTVNSNLMFTTGTQLTKMFDIHLGSIAGLNANTTTTHTGSLTVDTAHNVTPVDLSGTSHNGEGTAGKVRINSMAGQAVKIWVTQPASSSCGTGTSWSNPTCKVNRANDATSDMVQSACALSDNLTHTLTDATSYLYVGGTFNFNAGHTCHTAADATDSADNATGAHTVHVAQQ